MLDKSDIKLSTTDFDKLFIRARRYEKAIDIIQDPKGNIITVNRNLLKFGMPPLLDNGIHKKPKF